MSDERMPDLGDVKMPGVVADGWYLATIENVEKKFWEDGGGFISVQVLLAGEGEWASGAYNLKTEKGERNVEQLKKLKALSVYAGLGEAGGYDLADLLNKKIGVRVGINKKGYATIWESDSVDADREWLNDGASLDSGRTDDDVPF